MAISYSFIWWDRLYELCYMLYEKVMDSGFRPDVIIGIARGGWVPARILSDLFFTRETANVKVDLYRGIYEREEVPRVIQALPKDVKWEKPLVVDDIADTGDSFVASVAHLKSRGLKDPRTASLHMKPWTKMVPDFYVIQTEAWVVYPWELKEFTFNLAEQLSKKGMSSQEIEAELFEVGLPMYYARFFFKQWQAVNGHKSEEKPKPSPKRSKKTRT